MMPFSSERQVARCVADWLHRTECAFPDQQEAEALIDLADVWTSLGRPASAEGLVKGLSRLGREHSLEWMRRMGYRDGLEPAIEYVTDREEKVSFCLRHSRAQCTALASSGPGILSCDRRCGLKGPKDEAMAELLLLAAEDALRHICSESVGPLQFEILSALDEARIILGIPEVFPDGCVGLPPRRHDALIAAFRRMADIADATLRAEAAKGFEVKELDGVFRKVVCSGCGGPERAQDMLDCIARVPRDILPLPSDGTVLSIDGCSGDCPCSCYDSASRTVRACPGRPEMLLDSLGRAYDFACGLWSATERFDPLFEEFITDIYGRMPALKKGSIKWYRARQEVFARMYEHHLITWRGGFEGISKGFGPDRKASEEIDMLYEENLLFGNRMPARHRSIADGSEELVWQMRNKTAAEDILYGGRHWRLARVRDSGSVTYAVLEPASGEDGGPMALKLVEGMFGDWCAVEAADDRLPEALSVWPRGDADG